MSETSKDAIMAILPVMDEIDSIIRELEEMKRRLRGAVKLIESVEKVPNENV